MWLKKVIKDIFLDLEKDETRIFIYKWDTRRKKEKIFAIDYDTIMEKNPTILIISLPYPQFERKYNHLTVVVSNLELFKIRLLALSKTYQFEISKISILPDIGHVIVKDFSIRDMIAGKNKGVVVRLYCQKVVLLSQLLQKNLDYYCVQSFARYQNVVQCFSNVVRYQLFKERGIVLSSLRGRLFRLKKCLDGKDFSLSYVDEIIDKEEKKTNKIPSIIDYYHHFFVFDNALYLELKYDERTEEIIGYDCYRSSSSSNSNNVMVKIRKKKKKINNDEKIWLLDILEKLENDGGLIIAVNETDARNLLEKIELYNLNHLYPHWKLSVKLGKGIKTHEIPSILYHTDECPSLETNNLNITNVVVSLLENFFQSIVFAPINNPFPLKIEGAKLKKNDNNNNNNNIPGGLVLAPTSGWYSNVTCLDFNSLYPNIMANFGIIKGRVCRASKNDEENEKIYYDYFHVLKLADDKDDFYYLSLKDGENPISVFCRYLIEKRIQNPNIGGSFKLMINSLYGLFANRKFSLFSSTVATTITKYGRFFLTRAVQFFKTKFKLDCLYGDTDSIFIHYHRDYDPQRLASAYNKKYPQIHLKVEAVFRRIILIRKKLYFGKIIEEDDDEEEADDDEEEEEDRKVYNNNNNNNNSYKFAGFQKKFLSIFRKFLCGLINAETHEELDSKKRMLTSYFFDLENATEKDQNFYWKAYIEPLLFVLKMESVKNFRALGYRIIRFDDGPEPIFFMRLNHILLSSNNKKEVIWKKRNKIKENDNIIFSRFSRKIDAEKSIRSRRRDTRGVRRRHHHHQYSLTLDVEKKKKRFFRNLEELESLVFLPLLGKTELSSLLLYVSIDSRHYHSLWLYNFLCFVYNKYNKKKETFKKEKEKENIAFVLPYDVLASDN